MTPEIFERTLRELLQRRPFLPFIVEMDDGERFIVDDPEAVPLSGGAAGFIGMDKIYFFNCDNVRHFLALTPEAAS